MQNPELTNEVIVNRILSHQPIYNYSLLDIYLLGNRVSQFEQLYLEGKLLELLELIQEDLSTAEAKYWHVSTILKQGDFDKALNLVSQYEKDIDSFEFEWKSKFLTRIGSVYHLKGKLHYAQNYYLESLKLELSIGKSKNMANLYNNIGLLHWNKGELDEALQNYVSSLDLMRKFGSNQDIAALFNNIGLVWKDKGNLDKALEYHDNSLKLRQEINNLQDIATSQNNIGSIYRLKGEPGKALQYHNNALGYYEKLGNKQGIAHTQNYIGLSYWLQGELDIAIEFYTNSLIIQEDIGNNQDIADLLNNIGLIYVAKGDLEPALEKYQESLKLREIIGNKHEIASSFGNIAELYRLKGLYEIAMTYDKNGLKLREEIGNLQGIAASLRSIIYNLVESNNPDNAKKYLERLDEIASGEKSDLVINLLRKHAQGLVFKSSKRSQNKIKAQEIFEEIVRTNTFDFEIYIDSLSHLIELLIHEFKTYQEDEVLDEIVQHVNLMQKITKDQKMYRILVDVYILQSRLAIIQNDFDKAHSLLTQALIISEEKNMSYYYRRVEDERRLLRQNFIELKDVIQTSSIAIQLEKIAILEYIKKARGMVS